MSKPAPRRRAERPSRRRPRERRTPAPASRPETVAPPSTREETVAVPVLDAPPATAGVAGAGLTRSERLARTRWPAALWAVVVGAALAALVACLLGHGPSWLCSVGAVVVSTAYSWALAVRTGGRPLVVALLAAVLGAGALVSGEDYLRTGAAVLGCVVAAVFAVMATVPAVRFVRAVREVVVALVIAGIGALATVGYAPVVQVTRFEYATLALAFPVAFALVYRLGAGLHGLGRRGVVIVLLGTAVLALTLAYAELLRRYGTPGLVGNLLDAVRWSRTHLGAFPRPLETVLGVPALVWGVHMRARRRQGWWVCAFGVAATTSVAHALVNPAITMTESALSVTYGALLGLALGFVVIRLDLALTAPRGQRGRRAEEANALRPEPRRTRALM